MTDSIRDYRFDFGKEVKAFRSALGPLLDKVIFIDVDIVQPAGTAPLKAVLPHVIGGGQYRESYLSTVRESIAGTYAETPNQMSGAWPLMLPDMSLGHAVVINNNHPLDKALGDENRHLMHLFFLYHEAAHALILDGPEIDRDHPYRECAADAYAALRLLQRFGQEAAALVSMISWYRSYEGIMRGTDHLSTTVLDRIIADSASDDFSTLSPAETIERARTYAREGTPTAKMLKQLRRTLDRHFLGIGSPHKARLVMDTCLGSKSQFAFYIGAKYFEPFLHPEGVVFKNVDFFKDEEVCHDAQMRERYRELIENRADVTRLPQVARLLGFKDAPSRLRSAFDKLAGKAADKTSLVKFLRVNIPTGQKRLMFRDV